MKEKFSISDIFKKFKKEKKLPESGIKFYKSKQEEIKEQELQPPDKVNFSIGMDLEEKNNASDSALYSEAVALCRRIYKNPIDKSEIDTGLYPVVKRMIDLMTTDEDKELLKCALADYLQFKDYFYYHIVNVCIFSLYLGHGLAYDRSQLIDLGAAAFLHDIGMSRYLGTINQAKVLSAQEYSDIKRHPIIGQQIIDEVYKNLNTNILEVIRQQHERIDGSGYPKELKDEEISEYSQIVGLSDLYEAMIHQRPHRKKHTPLDAIKIVLSNKYAFVHRVVKVLIEKIGIFPVGSFIQLSTKEIGQVLRSNPELPLRPVVNIIFDSSGRKLEPARQINLADSPTVYILGMSSNPTGD